MVLVCTVLVVAFVTGYVDQGMYIAMFGLALIMIVKGYGDVRFFDRETKLASSQVSVLENVHSFEEFLAGTKPSMFRSHIANLYEIAYTFPEVSQDNLIELMHSRLMARNRVVALFASVLVTLGLVGTILGLMIMMDKLKTQVRGASGEGAEQFIEKLFGPNGALDGLDTAFITTLIGAVLGGVVLRVLTSVVDANIMKYTAHVAELTEVYVLPSMRRTALELEEERTAAEEEPAPKQSSPQVQQPTVRVEVVQVEAPANGGDASEGPVTE
ncbi:MAG: MotA/TolQ/ExbB proton channel family protein [Planctomycetota bacterium]|nr:MotA/TolQ/ExbB proton channel family protein [Planctomycetota bacterium]